MMNAVTCLKWIRRGVSKRQPDEVKLTDSDINGLIESVQDAKLSDSDNETTEVEEGGRKRKIVSAPVAAATDDISDEDEDDEEASELASDDNGDFDEAPDSESDDNKHNPLLFSGLSFYKGGAKDPDLLEAADSDDEDMQVLPDDNLVVIGKVKKDFCTLEVYVYNEKDNNCFCHHDLILPTIPLCMEWLDYDPAEEAPANFLAVGNVGPDIELWDLDVVNSLEPACVLAGTEKESGRKKKKKTSHSGHSDAVLGLSWNQAYRHVLASGSADCSVALWDLAEGKVVTSIEHPDKVQALQWQAGNAQSLLTGCADQTVNLYDCSSMEPSKKSWSVSGEVETVCWDAFNEHHFFVGTDSGLFYKFDSRAGKALCHIQAHSTAVSSIAQSSQISGCLVTAGTDKVVKIWDIRETAPKPVFTKKMKMGQLFDISGCPDSALLFAVAGELEFRVLNFAKTSEINEAFSCNVDKDAADESLDIEVPIGYDNAVDSESSSGEETQAADTEEKPGEAAAAELSKSKKKRLKKKASRKLKTPITDDAASQDMDVKEAVVPATVLKEVDTNDAKSSQSSEVSAAAVSTAAEVEVKPQPEKVKKLKKKHVHPAAKRMKSRTKQQPVGDEKHKRF